MRWPWSKREPEQRSQAVGYTASLTAALQAGAEGGVSDTAPLATAALEAAAGLYARGMAACLVQGADDVADALTPPVLALIARNLIRRGEDHHRIYVRGGRLVLEPVGFAYAHGAGPDPMRWTYSATLYGPTDSRHEWVRAVEMLHTRYSVDASRPWLGVPPWSWAASTSQAIAALDRLVANEASKPHGSLLGGSRNPRRPTKLATCARLMRSGATWRKRRAERWSWSAPAIGTLRRHTETKDRSSNTSGSG